MQSIMVPTGQMCPFSAATDAAKTTSRRREVNDCKELPGHILGAVAGSRSVGRRQVV